ncbi:MAG: hypothetical protein ACQCN6_14145 [Candidatus Bathyarchaeia archaeon]|jgi:hypothetical protein
MPIDISKLKKEFISISDVPSTSRRSGIPWDELFSSVPPSKAMVLQEPDVREGTLRSVLQRKHREGKYQNIRITATGEKGKRKVYICNDEKPVVQKQFKTA